MVLEYPPRSPIARQCIRIRLTNSVTGKSKNLRLTEKDLDDSVLEKVYENPAAQLVCEWPSEESEQLATKSVQIQCVMKRTNQSDKLFSENDLGKTSIQDMVDFQKEDNGRPGDVIQLALECVPVIQTKEEEKCQTPPRTQPEEAVLDMTHLQTRLSLSMSPRSPSILKSPSSSTSASKRVSFGGSSFPAHLDTPTFDNLEPSTEAVSE